MGRIVLKNAIETHQCQIFATEQAAQLEEKWRNPQTICLLAPKSQNYTSKKIEQLSRSPAQVSGLT